MSTSRTVAMVLLGGLMGVGLWVIVNAGGERGGPARAEDLSARSDWQSGTVKKLVVPEDPQEREAVLQEYREQEAAREARRAEEVRAQACRWKGSQFVPSAPRSSADEYAQQEAAAGLLAAAQTVPASRLEFFRATFAVEGYRHVGWEGTVVKVIDAPDGRRIELRVRPSLVTAGGGIAYTLRTYREIWRFDESGRLFLERGESGGGLGGIFGG
jgi:hypothetical protein